MKGNHIFATSTFLKQKNSRLKLEIFSFIRGGSKNNYLATFSYIPKLT